jgi:hypothetical protein
MKPDAKWNRIRAGRVFSEEEVYGLMGLMLVKLHRFEKIMRFSFHLLHATFAPSHVHYDAALFIGKMRRKACGIFCHELRTVVKIDADFDHVLQRLVRRRNQFAHKLSLRKQFDPARNPQWHQNVARFIFRLEADVDVAWNVFSTCAETLVQQMEEDPRSAILKSNVVALKVFKPIRSGTISPNPSR